VGNDGTMQNFSYDANGQLIQQDSTWTDPTDPGNSQSQSSAASYDATGKVTSGDGQTQNIYDAAGHLIQTIDSQGNVTKVTYDPSGLLLETLAADGSVTRNVYDALGRVTYSASHYDPTQTAPSGTHTVFDANGRVTLSEQRSGMVISIITTPSGASYSKLVSAGSVLTSAERVYDVLGRLVQSDDGTGRTSFQYDATGLQTAVIAADGSQTLYEYDADGRNTKIIAPGGTTRFEYDAAGHVTKTTYPDGTTQTNVYGTTGNRTSKTDTSGATLGFQYDTFGRMIGEDLPSVSDPSQSGALAAPHYAFAYGNVNQVRAITDPLGHVTQIHYNSSGQRTALVLPGGQIETLSYKLNGQAAANASFSGSITTFNYDTSGRITGKSFYEDAAHHQALQAAYTLSYTYDDAGLVHTVTDSRTGTTTYSTTPAVKPRKFSHPSARSL